MISINTFATRGQTVNRFFELSSPVKLWVITHPFAACKSARITEKALAMTEIVKMDARLDSLKNGGQLDAFRHAYWMALMSKKFNCRKAYRLGKAHEKGNKKDFTKRRMEEGELPDSVSIAMDMYNNCVGVQIGFENKLVTEEELAEIVIQKILEGKMLIVKRNSEGEFLNCEGAIIPGSEWRGRWNNSRCLVKSDEPFHK